MGKQMIQECHGHENNEKCKQCKIYNNLTFSWDFLCSENEEMLNNKMKKQLEEKNKKELKKSETYILQEIKKSEEDKNLKPEEKIKKLKRNSFFKDDFYYNFNYGVNFFSLKKSYLVKIYNLDSGNKLGEFTTIPGEPYFSPQKFYIRWGIKVYDGEKLFLEKELDLNNKDVFIESKSDCIGDNVAWIKAVDNFQKKHNCNLTCVFPESLIESFSITYPNIRFLRKKDRKKYEACYYLKCGHATTKNETIVYHNIIALDKIAEYILEVEHQEKPKKMITTNVPDFGGEYVCYSERASSAMKEWNNPEALKEVIEYIQSLGLKVVNIDQMPLIKDLKDVIYLNGKDISIQERINTISGAKFFIGMASGMSWLSWACHIPTIMISSFSLPLSEYENPYRVFSKDFCFGCWNLFSAINCSNNEKYICNKGITAKQVIEKINQIMEDLKND